MSKRLRDRNPSPILFPKGTTMKDYSKFRVIVGLDEAFVETVS